MHRPSGRATPRRVFWAAGWRWAPFAPPAPGSGRQRRQRGAGSGERRGAPGRAYEWTARVLATRRRVTEVRSQAISYRRFVAPQRQALERLAAAELDWLDDGTLATALKARRAL